MSDSVSANDPLHPTPAATPVLARLPRVGLAATPEPTFAEEPASGPERPILVLLDDDSPPPTDDDSPPPTDDDSLAPSDGDEVAVEALAAAATPAWQEDLPPGQVEAFDDEEPAAAGSDMDVAGATPIFRVHRYLAPYSSVIVTVAVIAAAGLLFMVASQPSSDRIDYDAAWAESALPAASPRTPDETTPRETVQSAATPAEKPTEPKRSPIEIAQRPAAGGAAEATPRALPKMTLGPPQAYPSTGSRSFEQAFFNNAQAAAEDQVGSEDGDTKPGRYERY